MTGPHISDERRNGQDTEVDWSIEVQRRFAFQVDARAWYVICRRCRGRFVIHRQEQGALEIAELLEHALDPQACL